MQQRVSNRHGCHDINQSDPRQSPCSICHMLRCAHRTDLSQLSETAFIHPIIQINIQSSKCVAQQWWPLTVRRVTRTHRLCQAVECSHGVHLYNLRRSSLHESKNLFQFRVRSHSTCVVSAVAREFLQTSKTSMAPSAQWASRQKVQL